MNKDITLEDLEYNVSCSPTHIECQKYEDGINKNIDIWLTTKSIQCEWYDEEYNIHNPLEINFEELQAIHNKLKDLGVIR